MESAFFSDLFECPFDPRGRSVGLEGAGYDHLFGAADFVGCTEIDTFGER